MINAEEVMTGSQHWDRFCQLKVDHKIEYVVYFLLYGIAAILMIPSMVIIWIVNKLSE